jgi:hypothetical protein
MKDCLARLKCDLRHLPIGSYRGHLCYWPFASLLDLHQNSRYRSEADNDGDL